jgi:hypothetical protein
VLLRQMARVSPGVVFLGVTNLALSSKGPEHSVLARLSPAGGSCRYGALPMVGGNTAAIFNFCSSVAPRADSSSFA